MLTVTDHVGSEFEKLSSETTFEIGQTSDVIKCSLTNIFIIPSIKCDDYP